MLNEDAIERLNGMRFEEDVPGVWTYSETENTALYLGIVALEICTKLGIEVDSEFGKYLSSWR